MPHIELPEGLPGIRGLFAFRPDTAVPMSELAEVLLHQQPHSLSPGERELIATYVSSQNDCYYCQTAHGAIAAHHLGGDDTVVAVKRDFETAPISAKLKALLAIAGKVQKGGKQVQTEDIQRAREQGATDLEIHDTVLIAAAFCMYNRYVDGLATWTPTDAAGFRERAAKVATDGYLGALSYIGSAARRAGSEVA